MSEGCSTSACNEVEDPNHQDALPDYANLSKTSEHNENGDCNGIENAPEEEDEDEDADFNPFLKENNSAEVSSSLSSEVEDLDTNVADSSMKDCQTSGNVDHGEEIVTQATAYAATTDKESILVTQSETESVCEKENVPTDVMDDTDFGEPLLDIDSDGAICMRTRARYSLASFTLDELETFLQESDDEDDLQNVDDEEEYRKFLAVVLRGDDSHFLTGNANADDEDEDNDADFELELEEALESEPEEVEERRMTRRNRSQKASLERNKKLPGKSNRPLLPLLPFASIQSLPTPNIPPSHTPPVNNGVAFGFTAHQIGQLHCLIHEHVQLLLQVFSLSVLEPAKNNIAAEVKELAVEMLRKRNQAVEWRKVPYPSFCFFPPYIHPSVSDGIHKTLLPKEGNGNVHRDMCLPDELAASSQTPERTSWLPYVCGPILSVMDVAPLRLVENYIDDVSSAVRAYERCQFEVGFESCSQKEPLFPLHNFPCSAESDDQGETENNPSVSSGVLCSSPSNQMTKKTMAGTLLERAKNQPVAHVPKEIAKLAQRFLPLFNPSLYPHKPPPTALVTRVLFTEAEDELLALGLMEYNTDWKAIQQRFLPCKSRHQIFVRQKNRASSKSSENPIKAVRRMKNSPLTSEEIARIDLGLKRFKLDWISIWRSFVPYRDPSLLPRQWRIACGTQKSYKSDADKNAKRRLNQLKRKTSKPSPSTGRLFSEKDGDSTDNAADETNCGDNRVDKEDEAYVHEAFLADWRPDDNNVSSNILNFMPSHDLTIHPQISSKSPAASSYQPVLRPCRARRQNNARVVKLAPDLPPLNLPPSVRVMSQSAFKSSQAAASSKISENTSRIPDLAGSSAKSGPYNITATKQHPNLSELQMHPLLFQAPQDGQLPYYPVSCTNSRSSSFNFFPSKQPQLSLGLFHNPRHIRDAVNFLSKSSKPPEKSASSSSPFGMDFHPLLQRSDDVDTHSAAAAQPACSTRAMSMSSVDGSSKGASRKKVASSNGKANELDLDMRLSFTSKKNQKSAKNKNSGDIAPVTFRNKGSRKVSDTKCDESLPEIVMEQEELSDSEEDEFGENVEFECEEMADSEGDSLSDSEQTVNITNEEEQLDEMDADIDDARGLNTLNTRTVDNNNTCNTSGGQSSGLESTGKGVNNTKPNASSLNLNSCPPVSPLSNPKNGMTGYEFDPYGPSGTLGQNQPPASSSKGSSQRIKPDSRNTLPRNPRKRVCRSKSNSSVVAGSGEGNSCPNIDSSAENLKNVS